MTLPIESEKLKNIISNQVEACGAELVELSFRRTTGRNILTIIVDKPGGITLEACAIVNKSLSAYFDSLTDGDEGAEFFRSAYFLEVNSPGLDRQLRTKEDFLRVIGQELRLVYKDEGGGTSVAEGRLHSADSESLEMEVGPSKEIKAFLLSSVIRGTKQIKFSK